jgi:hypothetical protein
MAKFGRYDPRNKKRDRNKTHSQNKDIRIRDVEENRSNFKIKGNTSTYAIIDEWEDEERDYD